MWVGLWGKFGAGGLSISAMFQKGRTGVRTFHVEVVLAGGLLGFFIVNWLDYKQYERRQYAGILEMSLDSARHKNTISFNAIDC
jgi:hypothetical protein